MDDFAAGAEDDNGVITIYYQLTVLIRRFSFLKVKWASNSENMRTQVPGVSWDMVRETIFTDHRDVTDKVQERPMMKRQLLQATSRFYDPLGLMSPDLITV
jgi:hypothetical protein